MEGIKNERIEAAFAAVDNEATIQGFSIGALLGNPLVKQMVRLLALTGKAGIQIAVKYLLALLDKLAQDNEVTDTDG